MKYTLFPPFQSSWRQGNIKITYQELVDELGKPKCFDDYKTDAEWNLLFSDGTYATIYNYKNGQNYCGEDGLETEDITMWNIGGTSEASANLVHNLFDTNDTKEPK